MEPTLSTRTARLVEGGLLAGALAWPDLPADMAVHWDGTGNVDGTAPRAAGAFGLPLLAAGLVLLLEAVPRIDPLGGNVDQFRGYYDGFVVVVVSLLVGVQAVVLAANLGWDVPVAPLVLGATGVVLGYVGVLLRHAEPNWFVGVRTPWTLSSETVWRRTHDLAGRLFLAAGGVLVLAAALGRVLDAQLVATTVVLVTVLVAALVPVAYSYYAYERLDRPDDAPGGGS